MTTTDNVTKAQLEQLRSEAAEAGDFVQVVLCDLALGGDVDLDDYSVLSTSDRKRIRELTRDFDADAALRLCVGAIGAAEGM